MPRPSLAYNNTELKSNWINEEDFVNWKNKGFHHFNNYEVFDKFEVVSAVDEIPTDNFVYEVQYDFDMFHDYSVFHRRDETLFDKIKIPARVIEKLHNKKNVFLSMTLVTEGLLTEQFIIELSHYLHSRGIPPGKFIYVSNSANGQEIIDKVYKKYKKTPKTVRHCYFPYFVKYNTNCDNSWVCETSEIKKSFLCFNNMHHAHRILFYTSLVKKDLLENFYFSMPAENEGIGYVQNYRREIGKLNRDNIDVSALGIDIKTIREVSKKLPLRIDGEYKKENLDNAFPQLPFFMTSAISVVTETYFFEDSIHLTEKTMVPISFGHPFILVSTPNSLAHLRKLGFRTFEKFWSEDYDQIKDHAKRMMCILELIQNISKWNSKKLKKFVNEVRPILEHNTNLIKHIGEDREAHSEMMKSFNYTL